MAKATVTERAIKNKDTGIDISVPEYRSITGKLSLTTESEYHVIVISNLPYFKTISHKATDVVQFMVPKKYGDFEALYRALSQRFPATVFPELPKKILMMKDSSQQERRIRFDQFMSFVASLPKMCTSNELLDFLGVRPAKIKQVEECKEGKKKTQEERRTPDQTDGKSSSLSSPQKSTSSDLFEEKEEDVEDIFGEDYGNKTKGEDTDDLFGEIGSNGNIPSKAGGGNLLFGADVTDDSNNPVYLPPGATEKKPQESTTEFEDNSDLLNIVDDLDDVFIKAATKKPKGSTAASKPKIPPKPKRADSVPKPADSIPKPAGSVLKETSGDLFVTDELKDDDILKYIQENTGNDETSLDLF